MHNHGQGFAAANLPSAPSLEHFVRLRAGGSTRRGAKRRGRRRRRNQDAIFVDADAGVYVLADGMGGLPGARAASRLVADELPLLLRDLRARAARNRTAMVEALGRAVAAISTRIHEADPHMGSTVAVAYVRGTRLFTAHLGDSRIYRLRGASLSALTRDHTVVQVMVDAGALDVLSASLHPARHHLTRYAGMLEAEVEVQSFRLRPRDRLLLCSDGVHAVLPSPCLERILDAHRCPAATADAILDTVQARGGHDDASCIVVDS